MKRKIGVVYLAAFLVGATQCQHVDAAPASQTKGSQKPKSTAKPANWNSGLSNMMDQLESQLGPKNSTPPAPPDLNGPDSIPRGLPPEPDTAGSSTTNNGTSASGSSVVTPGASTPPANKPDDDSYDDDDKPGAPAVVPMPPDNFQGLMPFGTGGSGTKNTASGSPSNGSNSASPTDSYFSEIEKVGLTRWDKTRYPVKIYIEPSSSAKGFRPEFVSILTQAFKDWGLSISSVPMEFVNNPTYAQISCVWTDNKADLMSNMEGGNTIVVPDDLGIMHVDMKILTVPPKEFPQIPTNFMRRVALHEAGHALGLAAHSPQSSDIMFGTIYPKDENCSLSARDLRTLQTLYSTNIAVNQRLDPARTEIKGDMSNPKVRAMQLNNEAAVALKGLRMDVAESKLKEAHKLDPTNKMVTSNLGAIYSNLGAFAGMARNFPLATQYYKQAVPLLEASNNKPVLMQVLSNYEKVLQFSNNAVELKNIQTKLQTLK